jgi:hypothetical protein
MLREMSKGQKCFINGLLESGDLQNCKFPVRFHQGAVL